MTPATGVPTTSTAGEVMSRPVLTVDVRETLWDAWQLLFVSGLRHLVVLDGDGSVVGVLNDRNILADVPVTQEHLRTRVVGEVTASTPSLRVEPQAQPRQVARLMVEQSAEAVPVIDADGKLLGVVTEGDLVRWLAR